jgi:hypothetical protein
MARKYLLQPTRADHPVKLRPFYHEVAEELAKLETVTLNDLAIVDSFVLDRRHQVSPPAPTPVPPSPAPAPASKPVDMLPLLQPPGDQGQQGSCSAFAGTHAQNLCEALAGAPPALGPSSTTYSEACLYWNTRALMGTTDQDSGGNLGDAIQAQEQNGTCISSLDGYNDAVFNQAPDAAAVADEANHKAKFHAYPIDTSNPANITKALEDGNPVYLGFYVWQGFENTGSDGIVPPPDGTNLGGHAQLFFFTPSAPAGTWGDQNSWGDGWGLGGRCWFPQAAVSTIMEAYALVPVAS